MIAVLGSFRFPTDAVDRARPLMRAVIEATLAEPGCRAYSYAEDLAEPGLFRVTEVWDDDIVVLPSPAPGGVFSDREGTAFLRSA